MKYFPGISGNEYLNDVIMAFLLILGINNFRIEKRLPTRITPFDITIAEKIPFRPKSKINIKSKDILAYKTEANICKLLNVMIRRCLRSTIIGILLIL